MRAIISNGIVPLPSSSSLPKVKRDRFLNVIGMEHYLNLVLLHGHSESIVTVKVNHMFSRIRGKVEIETISAWPISCSTKALFQTNISKMNDTELQEIECVSDFAQFLFKDGKCPFSSSCQVTSTLAGNRHRHLKNQHPQEWKGHGLSGWNTLRRVNGQRNSARQDLRPSVWKRNRTAKSQSLHWRSALAPFVLLGRFGKQSRTISGSSVERDHLRSSTPHHQDSEIRHSPRRVPW